MTPLGTVVPPTPPGQHVRNGTVVPAGSVKKGKEPSALTKRIKKLSMRERVMIVALVVLAIAGVLAFFVVLPAIEAMQNIRTEIENLEAEKSDIHVEPDLTPGYREQIELAVKDYENYQNFYYPFMEPETIDRTITDLLLDNSLTPIRLSMSSIVTVDLLPYSTRTLVPKPVPAVEIPPATGSANNSATDGKAGANTGANANSQGGEEASSGETSGQSDQAASPTEGATGTAEGAAETTGESVTDEGGLVVGSSIYCYTIDVEAKGWIANLLAFLEATRSITAMEVVSYSYAEPPPEPPTNSIQDTNISETDIPETQSDEPEGGTIVLQIKLYVFVDGGVTSSDEE
jgi:hypothetical protein